jgi:mono/diheme cytochrome c family protein
MAGTARRLITRLALAALVAGAVLVLWVIVSVNSDRPITYANIEDHFKYGSIGSEPGGSLLSPIGGVLPPYWVFTALPSVCRDKLPGGYASLGFVMEPGKDLPVGVSRRRRFGVDHVGLNCAVCHTSTVRDAPGGPARVVLGMPAQRLDLQAFVQFVLDCTLDSRLTADAVRGRLPRSGGPSLFERALLRTGLIDRLKLQTLDLRNRIAPILVSGMPRWGRGRVDTFNPYKAIQFNWDLSRLPPDELIGASDYPSLWNQQPREGMHLHWDGDNDSVDERNLSAALGAGVTPVTVDHDNLKRVRDWIWTLPPPAYPYPIDRALAGRGEPLYQQQCQDCHADHRFRDGVVSGSRVGKVVPIAAIGTDRHRLDSYTFTLRDEPVRPLPGLAVPLLALPEDQRLREPSARRHLAARPRFCTTGRCPRSATCLMRRSSVRPCSTAATTSSTRRGSASFLMCRVRTARPSRDTTLPFPATRIAAMSTVRRWPTRRSARSSST